MKKIDTAALTEVQATLLMPLWSRAQESRRDDPLIIDKKAEQMVQQLEFDFSLFDEKGVSAIDYCLRASTIDELVRQFLHDNDNATVVEIGVGLDTRSDRLDDGETTWVEFDLPDAMHVRMEFIPPSPQRHQIAGSLLDPDWMDKIHPLCDGPILFVAEGVFYFFTETQIREILRALADRFPTASLIFDAQSPLFLAVSNFRHPMRDSGLTFSLANVSDVETWDQRLKLKQYVGFGDSPYYDAGMPRLSRLRRWGRKWLPPIRHLFKIVHVEWRPSP